MKWKIHHTAETVSTNIDARAGAPGDVYIADFQTAGRGRLNHSWEAARGENLTMSVVLDVAGHSAEDVATLPLVMGWVVVKTLAPMLKQFAVRLKWPNDVWADGKKICGILCERRGNMVIAGIGINVRQRTFAPEYANRATSLAHLLAPRPAPTLEHVRTKLLATLDGAYSLWQNHGFAAIHPLLAKVDLLKGHIVSVRQTDDDVHPITGRSRGIRPDGALDVAGHHIYAGEAHVEEFL